MYDMLRHTHSGFRWIVLILLIVAIVNAFMKWQSGKSFTAGDKKLNLFTMTGAHIQLLLGIALFFVSPKVVFTSAAMKDKVLRFFLVEHSVLMLIAVVLITIGYSRAKRLAENKKKFKASFVFFLLGLLVILLAIPWPFQQYGAAWF